MKKRICLLLIAACLFVSAFAGCALRKKPSVSSDTVDPTVTTDPDIDSVDPKLEAEAFGGTFTMFGRQADYYSFPYNELDGNDTKSILDSKIFARNMYIQNKYSIQLICINEVSAKMQSKATTAFLSGGDDAFDAILAPTTVSFSMAVNGLLESLEDMPYINLNKPYYDQSLKQDTSIKGKHYFVHGHFSIGTYNAVAALYLNKTMLNSYSTLSDPYELAESGDWTWAEMFNMCKEVTSVGEGLSDPGEGQYGLGVGVYAWQPLFFSSGASLVVKNDEDIPVLNLANCMDVIMDINRVLNDSTTTFFSSSAYMHSSYNAFTLFTAGHSLFMSDPLYNVPEYLIPSGIDYGILPIPKYSETQDKYYSQTHPAHSTVISVAKQSEANANWNKTGKIIEDFAYQSSLNVYPVIVDNMIKVRNAKTEKDFEMLEILFSNVRCDMGLSMSNELKIDSDIRQLLRTNDSSISSTLTSKAPTYQAIMDDMINAW